MISKNFDVLALLVTGGWNGLARRSAELVFKNGSSCQLPDLPEYKAGHIQAGVFTCGGGSSSSPYPTSCYTLTGSYIDTDLCSKGGGLQLQRQECLKS